MVSCVGAESSRPAADCKVACVAGCEAVGLMGNVADDVVGVAKPVSRKANLWCPATPSANCWCSVC